MSEELKERYPEKRNPPLYWQEPKHLFPSAFAHYTLSVPGVMKMEDADKALVALGLMLKRLILCFPIRERKRK